MVGALLPAAALAQDTTEEVTTTGARAALLSADGNIVGDVLFSALPDDLTLVQVSAQNMPPGFHGFHVHTTGVCDPSTETAFESAGSHIHADEASHPQHGGDLPVLYVTQSGMATMAVVTDRFTVEQLLDDDGSAIMVHENPDNYGNIPERYGTPDEETLNTGDAGPRIACGVIEANAMMEAQAEMSGEGDSTMEAAG
jgi:Cu-Zn family superoxide dismutase